MYKFPHYRSLDQVPEDFIGPCYFVNAGNDTVFWVKNKKIHRTNGPAIHSDSGYEEWIHKGKRHRLGGPALIWSADNLKVDYFIDGIWCTTQQEYLNDPKMIQYKLNLIDKISKECKAIKG